MNRYYLYIIIFVLSSCSPKESEKPYINHSVTKDSVKQVQLFNDEESLLRSINENQSLAVYGKEVYRFYLVRPFNPIVMFRIVNVNSDYQLTTKIFYSKYPDGQGKDTLISKRDTVLSESDAMKFSKDLYSSMFWNLKSDTNRHVLDAILWKIEGFERSADSSSDFKNSVELYYRKIGPLNSIYKRFIELAKVNLEIYE